MSHKLRGSLQVKAAHLSYTIIYAYYSSTMLLVYKKDKGTGASTTWHLIAIFLHAFQCRANNFLKIHNRQPVLNLRWKNSSAIKLGEGANDNICCNNAE